LGSNDKLGFDVDAILLAERIVEKCSPLNVYATAKASDFKVCMHLGFAKAHNKISRRRKVGVVLG